MVTKVITVLNSLNNSEKDEDSGKKQNKKEKPAKRVQVVEQTILQKEDDSSDLNIMVGRVGD